MKYDVVVGLVNKTKSGFQQIEKNLDGLDRKASKLGSGLGKLGGPAAAAAKGIAALAAAAATAAAAVVGLTLANAGNIKEMSNFARVAGVGVEEFQRLAFGAKSVGVEQDKLSDILKDVNDKVGDFMQTGAGPMADFFENIGPKVGVTADHFKDLSGPDALQLYVSSLEAANVSQADMTFYMEAIASDATLLLPLLADSGAGFEEMGQKAEAAGLILDDLSVNKVVGLKSSFETFKSVMQSVGDQITVGLAPGLQALIEKFTELATGNMPDIASIAERVFSGVINIIGRVIDIVAILKLGFENVTEVAALLKSAFITAFGAIARGIEVLLNGIVDGVNSVKQALNDLTEIKIETPGGKVLVEIEGLQLEMTDPFEFSGSILEDGVEAQQDAIAAINANNQAIENIYGGGGAGAQFVQEIEDRTAAINAQAEAAAEATNMLRLAEMDRNVTETVTPTLQPEFRPVGMDNTANAVAQAQALTNAAAAEAEAALKATDDAAQALNETLGSRTPEAVNAMTPAMEEAKSRFESLQGSIRGLGNTLTQDLATALQTGQGLWESFGNFFTGLMDMILQKIMEVLIVKPLMDAMFGSMGGFGGGGSGFLGAAMSSIFGIPMFANGGHLPTGQTGIVGEAGPELVKGPADIYSNAQTTRMMDSGGGTVISPVFQTTINPSEDTSPEAARAFANQFNKAVEAKVTDTIIKIQNRGGGRLQNARSY